MRNERLVTNRKRSYRIYSEEKLQMRTRNWKKLKGLRASIEVPSGPNQRCSVHFVPDRLGNGRGFRVLNIHEDGAKDVVGQLVAHSISGHQVACFLTQLIEERGAQNTASAITEPNSTTRQCSFEVKAVASSCHSFSPASRLRTRSWKA